MQARIQDFMKGAGGGERLGGTAKGGGVIAPVGEKLLFEHKIFSYKGGGGTPLDPPLTWTRGCRPTRVI